MDVMTASMTLTIAAVADVLKSSHFRVNLTRSLVLGNGRLSHQNFALQKDAALKVAVNSKFPNLLWCSGVVSSPNFPGAFPPRTEKYDTIHVKKGLHLLIQFTTFRMMTCCDSYVCGYMTITDGDGATLMEKSCGGGRHLFVEIGGQRINQTLPPKIKTASNTVTMLMTATDLDENGRGYSLRWAAVTPGKEAFVPK